MNRRHYDSFADHQTPGQVEPERLTPFKYTSNHSASSFSAGILVCVKQKYLPNNDIINNVNIIKISKSIISFFYSFRTFFFKLISFNSSK